MFAPAAAASAIRASALPTFASFDSTHRICTRAIVAVAWAESRDRPWDSNDSVSISFAARAS